MGNNKKYTKTPMRRDENNWEKSGTEKEFRKREEKKHEIL